jgi:hypothetical protein
MEHLGHQKNQLLIGPVLCPEKIFQVLIMEDQLKVQESLVDLPKYPDLVNTLMYQDGIGHVASQRRFLVLSQYHPVNLADRVDQVASPVMGALRMNRVQDGIGREMSLEKDFLVWDLLVHLMAQL